jgi:hypothetical protein
MRPQPNEFHTHLQTQGKHIYSTRLHTHTKNTESKQRIKETQTNIKRKTLQFMHVQTHITEKM